MGKLALYGAELSEYKPEKFNRCFMLKDSKGNELVLRAPTEEDMHSWRTRPFSPRLPTSANRRQ